MSSSLVEVVVPFGFGSGNWKVMMLHDPMKKRAIFPCIFLTKIERENASSIQKFVEILRRIWNFHSFIATSSVILKALLPPSRSHLMTSTFHIQFVSLSAKNTKLNAYLNFFLEKVPHLDFTFLPLTQVSCFVLHEQTPSGFAPSRPFLESPN